ncbi:MAG: hypothetical protein ACLURV_10650 [Gallintestinimicrobium sp.]
MDGAELLADFAGSMESSITLMQEEIIRSKQGMLRDVEIARNRGIL